DPPGLAGRGAAPAGDRPRLLGLCARRSSVLRRVRPPPLGPGVLEPPRVLDLHAGGERVVVALRRPTAVLVPLAVAALDQPDGSPAPLLCLPERVLAEARALRVRAAAPSLRHPSQGAALPAGRDSVPERAPRDGSPRALAPRAYRRDGRARDLDGRLVRSPLELPETQIHGGGPDGRGGRARHSPAFLCRDASVGLRRPPVLRQRSRGAGHPLPRNEGGGPRSADPGRRPRGAL